MGPEEHHFALSHCYGKAYGDCLSCRASQLYLALHFLEKRWPLLTSSEFYQDRLVSNMFICDSLEVCISAYAYIGFNSTKNNLSSFTLISTYMSVCLCFIFHSQILAMHITLCYHASCESTFNFFFIETTMTSKWLLPHDDAVQTAISKSLLYGDLHHCCLAHMEAAK